MNSLSEWIEFLETLDPSKIELGLDRISDVYHRMRVDFGESKIVIIGGTNGKGSTVAALESLCLSVKKSVGCYTSPHLMRFNERIRLNGNDVSDQQLVAAFQRVELARQETLLTYFEFTTLAAFAVFEKEKLELLLFEVGLGGRLDAVNILEPHVSIVTGVALDHTDWLGHDLNGIAKEKAGIYRKDVPAIFASQHRPVSVDDEIKRIGANSFFLDTHFSIKSQNGGALFRSKGVEIQVDNTNLPLPSLGAALAAYAQLFGEPQQESLDSLANLEIAGRYQQIRCGSNLYILDVAHNAQASSLLASRVRAEIDRFCPKKVVAVFGAMIDKDLKKLLEPMLGLVNHWYLVRANLPRAAQKNQLLPIFEAYQPTSQVEYLGNISTVPEMLPEEDSIIIVFGSFYTIANFMELQIVS